MLRGPGVLYVTVALAVVLGPARTARADSNDIVVSRLGNVVEDSMGNPVDVVGNNLDYRSMVSELGVVLAPRLLTPSDTLGFSGFQFAVDLGFTSIANDAGYWRVLESSENPTATDVSHGDGVMQTVGLFVRKGVWLPLPSFEVGAGAVKLVDSDMWTAQGYAKFAIHEGFHDLPLPSVAARGAVSRMLGSKDLDLTVVSFDVSLSKALGLGGIVNLEPFGGYNVLVIIPRSEVIDKTPHISSFDDPMDNAMNFVFRDQDNILRNRIFLGTKLQYYVFELTFEANFALAGSSTDDRAGTDVSCVDITDPTEVDRCDAVDQSGGQQTFTLSLGLNF